MILSGVFGRLRIVSDTIKGFLFIRNIFILNCLWFQKFWPSRLAEVAGGAVFKLGAFGNFGFCR
jgi:hypothetical protein